MSFCLAHHDGVDGKLPMIGMVVDPEGAAEQYKPMTAFKHLKPSLRELLMCFMVLFHDCLLGDACPTVLTYIQDKGFSAPSPIQSQCWPPLIDGRDVIGIAATGSGKTLAFLAPAMLRLASAPPLPRLKTCQPRVLVVAPTR